MGNKPKFGNKSYHSAINGVAKYQSLNYQNMIDTKDPNKYFSQLSKLMRRFLNENNLKCIDNDTHKAQDKNANTIQDNWVDFKLWLSTINL